MKGTAKVRVQGAAEPILGRMLKERGLDEPPLWKHRPPETRARMARWRALGEVRDPNRVEIPDVEAATATPKQMAYDLGASVVGCAKLTRIMIAEGVDLAHDYIFCLVVAEDKLEELGRQVERLVAIYQKMLADSPPGTG